MDLTRGEYLIWARNRALCFVAVNEPYNGMSSMLRDLGNSPELANHPNLLCAPYDDCTNEGVRDWLHSFRTERGA